MSGFLSYSSLVSYSKITLNNTAYFCEYVYTKYKTIEWNYKAKTIVISEEEENGMDGIRGERSKRFNCIYTILFLNSMV